MVKERSLNVEGFDYLIPEGSQVVGLIAMNKTHGNFILKDSDSFSNVLSCFFESSCVPLAKTNPVYASQSSAGLDTLNKSKGGNK